MSDLTIFFYETFDVTIEKIIEKLWTCFLEERYQAQTIILDKIIQNNIVLKKNTIVFWQYVLNDNEN
jgi:hypothetical protein